MRKQNGYVFMETLVVLSVLSVILLLLYGSFSYILKTSKNRNVFDTTDSLYKNYFVKEMMIENSGSSKSVLGYFTTHTGNGINECVSYNDGISSNSYKCDLSKDDYNGDLLNAKLAFEVDKVYYINAKDVMNSPNQNEWLNTFDATTIDYIRSLGVENKNYLVIKYKKKYRNNDGTYEVFHSSLEV